MLLKTHNKSGIVCWSNSKNNNHLLASSSLTSPEANDSVLEILSLDVSEKSKELNIVGSASYDNSFRCLAWDNYGEK
jgi:hypothetical protein